MSNQEDIDLYAEPEYNDLDTAHQHNDLSDEYIPEQVSPQAEPTNQHTSGAIHTIAQGARAGSQEATREGNQRQTSESREGNEDAHARTQQQQQQQQQQQLPKLTKLIVRELTWWTTDLEMMQVLESAGLSAEIDELQFQEHKINGKSRGIVHIDFLSPEAAYQAKTVFETKVFHGVTPTVVLVDKHVGNHSDQHAPQQPRNNNYRVAPSDRPAMPFRPYRPISRPYNVRPPIQQRPPYQEYSQGPPMIYDHQPQRGNYRPYPNKRPYGVMEPPRQQQQHMPYMNAPPPQFQQQQQQYHQPYHQGHGRPRPRPY